MKRLSAFFVLATLFLAACGSTTSACSQEIWTGKFGICIAEDWEQVPNEDLQSEGVPEETIGAFQLKEPRAGQRDNIIVSRERIAASVDSTKYAEANVRIIEKTPEYALIEKRDVKIDGQETLLHIFSARPVKDLPARRFYQISLVDGNRGYVFTGTVPFSVSDDVDTSMTDMMLSVTLQEK